MAERVHLRAATANDLPAMAALLAAEGLPTGGVAEGIMHFRVLDNGEGVIGTAGIEPHGETALLRSVVVAPSHRGRGHARTLTERMVKHADEMGLASLYLLTTDADGYFEGLGFEHISRDQAPQAIRHSQQFREQCPDSAILMRLVI